jgi:hypothetical protein
MMTPEEKALIERIGGKYDLLSIIEELCKKHEYIIWETIKTQTTISITLKSTKHEDYE